MSSLNAADVALTASAKLPSRALRVSIAALIVVVGAIVMGGVGSAHPPAISSVEDAAELVSMHPDTYSGSVVDESRERIVVYRFQESATDEQLLGSGLAVTFLQSPRSRTQLQAIRNSVIEFSSAQRGESSLVVVQILPTGYVRVELTGNLELAADKYTSAFGDSVVVAPARTLTSFAG